MGSDFSRKKKDEPNNHKINKEEFQTVTLRDQWPKKPN